MQMVRRPVVTVCTKESHKARPHGGVRSLWSTGFHIAGIELLGGRRGEQLVVPSPHEHEDGGEVGGDDGDEGLAVGPEADGVEIMGFLGFCQRCVEWQICAGWDVLTVAKIVILSVAATVTNRPHPKRQPSAVLVPLGSEARKSIGTGSQRRYRSVTMLQARTVYRISGADSG